MRRRVTGSRILVANQTLALLVGGILASGMAWPMGEALAADPAFQMFPGERQLFLDDVGIAGIENLTRTMHRPDKKGAVIRPDPTQGGSLQIRHAPVWHPEEKVFKLLVADTRGPTSKFRWYSSADGLHWSVGAKPNMSVYSVVYDEQDPDPARRYKAALPPTGFAVSPDGVTWTMLNVPGISSSDEANFSYHPKESLFLLTVKRGGPHGRSVGLATSKDFEHWEDHGLTFHADDLDQMLGHERIRAYLADPVRLLPLPEHPAKYTVDVYNMGLFRYEGLYIGVPAMHHRHTARPPGQDDTLFHVVELVCSRDAKYWTRLGNREPWLDVSRLDSGAYDSRLILPPSCPVVRGSSCRDGADNSSGDQLWFYYSGGKAEPVPDGMAICLAVLRRDGFVSLDAGEQEGTVQTAPFKLAGTVLFVNVDAAGGELRVEVLDSDGRAIAKSEPVSGDLQCEPVRWSEGNIAEMKPQNVSLRVTLRNARFYSYWLQ